MSVIWILGMFTDTIAKANEPRALGNVPSSAPNVLFRQRVEHVIVVAEV